MKIFSKKVTKRSIVWKKICKMDRAKQKGRIKKGKLIKQLSCSLTLLFAEMLICME